VLTDKKSSCIASVVIAQYTLFVAINMTAAPAITEDATWMMLNPCLKGHKVHHKFSERLPNASILCQQARVSEKQINGAI
jgi:hypothetical protein